MIFPWQQKQWQQLWQSKQENRLPHALLFTGLAGIGKAQFADDFTRALLCQQEASNGPCGFCHACRLIAGHAHPNVIEIKPEKPGQAIKIDQIREVTEFIQQSSLDGLYRIVVINPADNMNINAANALLKTLEEPSAGALLILISHQAKRLPATILSRCQRVLFPTPSTLQALPWLKEKLSADHDAELLLRLAHGAPLAALQLAEEDALALRNDLLQTLCKLSQKQADPVKSAAKLNDLEAIKLVDFMLTWVMDMLRLQLGSSANDIINQDYQSQLVALNQHRPLKSNIKFMAYLQNVRGQLCTGINLNKQLLVESMLIRWMECA